MFKYPGPIQISDTSNRDIHYDQYNSSGYCIIVNNEELIKQDGEMLYRPGSSKDAKDIKAVFEKFGFVVISKTNLDKTETLKLMEDVATHYDHADKSSLFVFLLSHGENEFIFSSMYEKIELSEILSPFYNCPTLTDKPKVFIVQACRGLTADVIPPPSLRRDFLIVYATATGEPAWRHPDEGTWYIQSFLEVIQKHHRKKFLGILTIVHSRFNLLQVPEFRSSLTKDFFLYKFQEKRPESRVNRRPRSQMVLGVSPKHYGSNNEIVLQSHLPPILVRSVSDTTLSSHVTTSLEPECYAMLHPPYGYCIVIDNSSTMIPEMPTEDSDHRLQDLSNHTQQFIETFQNVLGFHVEKFTNLSGGAINLLIDSIRKVDHSKLSCFVLAILSHGSKREIYGTDGQSFSVNDILDNFSDTKCESLCQKPKLFIFQTIQYGRTFPIYFRYNLPSDSFLIFSTPKQNDVNEFLLQLKNCMSENFRHVASILQEVKRNCENCEVECKPIKASRLKLNINQPRQDLTSSTHTTMIYAVWRIITETTASRLNDQNAIMKNTSRRIRIARIVGSCLSLTGTVISTTGFILIPFTLGGSVGVIILGSSIGIAGGITSIVSTLVKKIKSKKRLKEIKRNMEDYEKLRATYCTIIDEELEEHLHGRDIGVFMAGNGIATSLHITSGIAGTSLGTIGIIYSTITSNSLTLQVAHMALTTVTVATGLGIGAVPLVVVGAINVADIIHNIRLLTNGHGSKTSLWLSEKIDMLLEHAAEHAVTDQYQSISNPATSSLQ